MTANTMSYMYLASDHLCIRVYSSKSCTWCKCNVFIEILKKNNLDCKQMQLCLNQEIINLKVTWTYTKIIWPWNLHETGHASLIHPGAACIDYHTPYEQVGPDIKGSRYVIFLLSVSWNWHLHTASGQHALILFISHSHGDRYRQCFCLEQSKIRQTSSGQSIIWTCLL